MDVSVGKAVLLLNTEGLMILADALVCPRAKRIIHPPWHQGKRITGLSKWAGNIWCQMKEMRAQQCFSAQHIPECLYLRHLCSLHCCGEPPSNLWNGAGLINCGITQCLQEWPGCQHCLSCPPSLENQAAVLLCVGSLGMDMERWWVWLDGVWMG